MAFSISFNHSMNHEYTETIKVGNLERRLNFEQIQFLYSVLPWILTSAGITVELTAPPCQLTWDNKSQIPSCYPAVPQELCWIDVGPKGRDVDWSQVSQGQSPLTNALLRLLPTQLLSVERSASDWY